MMVPTGIFLRELGITTPFSTVLTCTPSPSLSVFMKYSPSPLFNFSEFSMMYPFLVTSITFPITCPLDFGLSQVPILSTPS